MDGAIVKTVAQEELLADNGRIKVNLKGSNKKQILTVQSKDAAGNQAESKPVSFLITSNIFIQWYANKPLFFGSIFITAGAGGFVFFRRRKILPKSKTTA